MIGKSRLLAGIAMSLGMNSTTLYDYEKPQRKKGKSKASGRKQWYSPDSPEVKRMSKGGK